MRKMKDSGVPWIGEIPEEWEIWKVKNISFPKSIQNHPDEEVLSLYRDFGVVIKSSRDDNFNRTSEDTTNYKFVEIGDLVINKMKTWQGSVAISKYQGIVSPAYYVFKIISHKVNRCYLHHLLRSPNYFPEYRRISGGIRPNQWDLDVTAFKQIPVLIPPISEQQRIADYLDTKCAQIDATIASIHALIDKLKEYKQSVITEVVTKGLDPDVPMKDSGVPWIEEIPEGWHIVPLKKQLINIVDYRGKTPEKVDSGIFLVTAKNIKNGEINYSLSQEYVSEKEYYSIMSRGLPHKGDILFTTEAPLGEVAIVDREDIALAQRIIKFTVNSSVLNNLYLKYWIISSGFQFFLHTLSTGSTAEGIKASKIFMLPLVLPPLPEQQRIADYLDTTCARIDAVLADKQALLDKLAEYKKSLIFECVTGKREVPA